jgi:hypothetical protein
VTRHDPPYEPPAVEVVSTENGPAVTAAGGTDVYTSITLIEDDGKKRSGE